jgi:hypothetical protein
LFEISRVDHEVTYYILYPNTVTVTQIYPDTDTDRIKICAELMWRSPVLADTRHIQRLPNAPCGPLRVVFSP